MVGSISHAIAYGTCHVVFKGIPYDHVVSFFGHVVWSNAARQLNAIKRLQCNLDKEQNWLSTDLIYFQILITVLLFGIFVEYKIQEIWKRFKKKP